MEKRKRSSWFSGYERLSASTPGLICNRWIRNTDKKDMWTPLLISEMWNAMKKVFSFLSHILISQIKPQRFPRTNGSSHYSCRCKQQNSATYKRCYVILQRRTKIISGLINNKMNKLWKHSSDIIIIIILLLLLLLLLLSSLLSLSYIIVIIVSVDDAIVIAIVVASKHLRKKPRSKAMEGRGKKGEMCFVRKKNTDIEHPELK